MLGMIVAFLGFLDLIAAGLLLWPDFWPELVMFFGIFYIIKGLVSMAGSFASGFWFDIMGAVDFLAGLCLVFAFTIPLLWAALLVKALLSLITIFQ